jgi:hypothetical protein
MMPPRLPADIGAARACFTAQSVLPGRFATNVAANYAVPVRAKSNASGRWQRLRADSPLPSIAQGSM